MTFIKRRKWIILAGFLILVYLSPLFIFGKDAHVRVHDQLDSTVIWYDVLADSGKIFAANDAEIPNMMNGLPRVALGTEFKLLVWLSVLFPPFVAFTINAVLVRFAAFIGMYLLLTKHVLKIKDDLFIPAGVALCFALLPFWLPGSLSIAGIPLAAYAFLNIRKRTMSKKDWIIILLLPFASSFILTFVFFLAAMGILWLKDWIRTKRSNWPMFTAITSMTAIYLAKNYRLVIDVLLGHGFTPHREEFNLGHNTLARTFGLAWENFTTAHTHSYTLQQHVIIYVAGFILLLILGKKLLSRFGYAASLHSYERSFIRLSLLAAAFSLWYAFWYWEGMRVLKNHFDIANTFNFGRIHFLNPVLWYLIFAVCLKMCKINFRAVGKFIAVVLILCQLFVVFSQNHELKYRSLAMPSWREFYSPALFDDIREYIGEDPANYRVVNIGMHPAVAQYNGFYTLDFYATMYPLDYKHQFRKIIAGELAKNETIQSYYDTWGSRCYIFLDELGKNYFFTKDKNKVVEHLQLDTKTLRKMGGTYIFSAVKIKNAEDNHLQLEGVFENDNAIWRIYLYKVDRRTDVGM